MSHKIIGLEISNSKAPVPFVINGVYTRVSSLDGKIETYLLANAGEAGDKPFVLLSLAEAGMHWNGFLTKAAAEKTLANGSWTFVGELNVPRRAP